MNHHTQQLLSLVDTQNKSVNYTGLNELLNIANKDKPFLFVFTMVWDVVQLPENGWQCIKEILEKVLTLPDTKILVLLTDYLKDKEEIKFLDLLSVEVAFVNGIMLTAYNEIFIQQKSSTNKFWNANTKKFLLLTGKWWKKNRIGLFHSLEKEGLIQHSEHSLFLPDKYDPSIQHFVSDYIPELHTLYKEKYNVNLDNTRTLSHVTESNQCVHHIAAIPYDHRMYERTSFRVISETDWENEGDPWITEKTWITIMNKHPFIIAGQKNTLKKLQKMGFITYTEYLPISYDLLDDNDRMSAIVENTKYWVHNIQLHENEIRQSIEHNYNHIMRLCERDNETISTLIAKYGLKLSTQQLMETTFY